MHEAAVLRLSSFRTLRPAFDAVLRTTILPGMRSQSGLLALFAGRKGPDEVGARVVASLWSSVEALDAAHDAAVADGPGSPLAETADPIVEILPVLMWRSADEPLAAGILRVARGRLKETDLPSFAEVVTRESSRLEAGGRAPSDLIMAASARDSFVMLTTWVDWSAIEEATGASISEPLRTKRLAALEIFEADHFELLTELASSDD